jgi:hypothetical protein
VYAGCLDNQGPGSKDLVNACSSRLHTVCVAKVKVIQQEELCSYLCSSVRLKVILITFHFHVLLYNNSSQGNTIQQEELCSYLPSVSSEVILITFHFGENHRPWASNW